MFDLAKLEKIVLKWFKARPSSDHYMCQLGKHYSRKYIYSVYHMNKKAFVIQHWYFRLKLK